jgi:micrococcal nuclease
MVKRLSIAVAALCLMASAQAKEVTYFRGFSPKPGTMRVIDGDTFAIGKVKYRIYGIDTPEHNIKCEAELAGEATDALKELTAPGHKVLVNRVKSGASDKYGRTLVKVRSDGKDVVPILIKRGLANTYTGGKKESWCE